MSANGNGRPYYEYRREKDEQGQHFQDFVVELAWLHGIVIAQYTSRVYQQRIGESRGGMEIKYDMQLATTGNVYIEYAEKAKERDGDFVDSGIMGDNWLYFIGNYDVVYVLSTRFLRQLKDHGNYRHIPKTTSKGFLLPKADAERYAALIMVADLEHRIAKQKTDEHIEAVHAELMTRQRNLFDDLHDL